MLSLDFVFVLTLLATAWAAPTNTPDIPESELRAVFLVLQNGQTTPRSLYPKDPLSKGNHWPQGFGVLEEMAKSYLNYTAQFQAGQDNFQQFYKLFNNKSHWDAWTSSDKATQQSAQIYLEVLASVLVNETFDSRHLTTNSMLDVSLESCPKAKKVYTEWAKSTNVTEFWNSNMNELESLEKSTGEKFLHETNGLSRLVQLAITLETERREKLDVPSWAIDNATIAKLTKWREQALWLQWQSEEVQRLMVGRFLNHIAHYGNHFLGNSSIDENRFHLFSTDANFQAILMQALGFKEELHRHEGTNLGRLIPLYNPAGTFTIEIYHTTQDQENLVAFTYSVTTIDIEPDITTEDVTTYFLYHPECQHQTKDFPYVEHLCTWQQFLKIIKPFLVENWTKECQQ